jgi:DNA-binding CsgD family transcriptional regulator
MIPVERDPYLALNARSNLALAQGILGAQRRALLRRLSIDAATAGLPFVELKAVMFAGILADIEGDATEAVRLLEECLPRQLALGHVNLIAQELCPRPELASRVLRRHRSNGLGPALIEALGHHWLFPQTAVMLKDLGPSQVATWIERLDALPHATRARHEGTRTRHLGPQTAPSSGTSPLDQLTARELEVLDLMAQSRTNDQIAADLFIAISTVKTHVNHILGKMGQTTRIGAVLAYQRLNPSPPAGMTRNPPWV